MFCLKTKSDTGSMEIQSKFVNLAIYIWLHAVSLERKKNVQWRFGMYLHLFLYKKRKIDQNYQNQRQFYHLTYLLFIFSRIEHFFH